MRVCTRQNPPSRVATTAAAPPHPPLWRMGAKLEDRAGRFRGRALTGVTAARPDPLGDAHGEGHGRPDQRVNPGALADRCVPTCERPAVFRPPACFTWNFARASAGWGVHTWERGPGVGRAVGFTDE